MKIFAKRIGITLAWIAAALLALELLMQAGAFFIKEHSWRANTHWLTGNLRVLALGDSNTYGLYLPAEASYPSQLEKQWNTAHPELPIEIINLGYPGTNSFRLLANLPEIIDTFKPDLVLLMIGFNDFWTPVETLSNTRQPNFFDSIKYHSRVYKLFYMLLQKKNLDAKVDSGERMLGGISGPALSAEEIKFLQQQTGLAADVIQSGNIDSNINPETKTKLENALQKILEQRKNQAPKTDILNTVKYGDKTFSLGINTGPSAGNSKQMENNLLAMLSLLDQRNTPYLLLNYPSNHGYYPAANRKIEKIAGQTHSHFIDFNSTFTHECRNKPETCPTLFFYDGHATAQGNQKVSEAVKTALENYFSAEK